MSGEIEFGRCEICGKQTSLQRTYWHYPIKCECHSPQHFEMVRHCSKCVAKEPNTTTIRVLTSSLSKTVTDEMIINYALNYVSHKDLKPANRGLIKDALIIGAKAYRDGLINE